MEENSINDVPVDKVESTKPINAQESQEKQPSKSFESLMQKGVGDNEMKVGEEPSPLDLAKSDQITGNAPTFDSITKQMNSTSSALGDLQKEFHKKDLKLDRSKKYRLRNKLTNVNNLIRSVSNQVGLDPGDPPPQLSRASPIDKFLGILIDSQANLAKVENRIQKLGEDGKPINPGSLLLVQVQLAKAQQELEYSSVLISTSVSGVKTLFNIQI